MSRAKAKFTDKLKADFPYLKQVKGDLRSVLCSLCNSTVSIANSGRTDIEKHLDTDKHKKGARSAGSCRPINEAFKKTPAAMILAAKEMAFAYHNGKHRLSGPTSSCESKLVKQCFDPKFSDGATKVAMLIKNVISPEIERCVVESLKRINFVSVITDCSNRKSDKMLPIIVRGFDEEKGVVIYKLAVKFLTNEKAETIGNTVIEVGRAWDIFEKVVAFAADNCPTNFGGVGRTGPGNVLIRLKRAFERKIVGAGCTSHVIHNATDTACDQIPIEIENLVVKIYKHFNLYTVRVESLKQFCEEAEVTFSKLVKHSGTRFLTLHPAVRKIIELFTPLKNYFESINNCPVVIHNFFNDELALFWLHFLDSQLELSNEHILKTETKKGASFEISLFVKELRDEISSREQLKFMPFNARPLFAELSEDSQNTAKLYSQKFYATAMSYLDLWSETLDGTEIFAWMTLEVVPDWVNDVEPSLKYALERISASQVQINADRVFDDLHSIQKLIGESLSTWAEQGTSSESRWIEIIKTMSQKHRPIKQLSLLVQYAFSIPGTSTEVERLFSVINDVWSPEKGQMLPATLDAHLNIIINSDLNCVQYYNSVRSNMRLLKIAQGVGKYSTQPSTSTQAKAADSDSDIEMIEEADE